MPFPVLHSFAGYSIYRAVKKEQKQHWLLALGCILLANLADFDYIPGIMLGESGRFHREIAHSIGAALLCGFLIGLAALLLKKRSWRKAGMISSGAYFSHAVMDFLNGPGFGFPILWPFSARSFESPFALFPTITSAGQIHPLSTATGFIDFFRCLMSLECMRLSLFEAALVIFISIVIRCVQRLRRENVLKLGDIAALAGSSFAFAFFYTYLNVL